MSARSERLNRAPSPGSDFTPPLLFVIYPKSHQHVGDAMDSRMNIRNVHQIFAQLPLRSRLSQQDAFILAMMMLALTLFALEFDFFENVQHMTTRERRITVGEFFALTGLLIVGLIAFSIRRLNEQKREFARRLIAETKAAEAHSQAMCDLLTGLPNRRALFEALAVALAVRSGENVAHALLLLDLDGFKDVNDRFGHPVGDKILVIVADRLAALAQGANLATRLGGDEFAVLCREVKADDEVMRLAHRIIEEVERPIVAEGTAHRVGASIGIALFPRHGRSEHELLQRADVALYRAKAEGRSAVRCYG
jgi:diguanylate cyclase (GGDEF)-like protein